VPGDDHVEFQSLELVRRLDHHAVKQPARTAPSSAASSLRV
jgi:hypothetical protein